MKGYLKRLVITVVCSVILFAVLTVLITTGVINGYYEDILMLICFNIILALSANLIINITGQLTLGHSAFMAIGAYACAILNMKLNLPFFLSLIIGAAVAAFFGFLIGLPTLRLKGDYLAITTLGFCQIIVVVFQNIPQFGGAQGLTGIPSNTTFAWAFFSLVVSALLMYNLVHSKHGRAMISVREDEIAAKSMGINTTKYKIMAFTIGAFFAGLAGGLYAEYMMFIEPNNSFNFFVSINFVMYVIFGGTGSFLGCFLSTSVLTFLPEVLRFLGSLRLVIFYVLLIVIMILREKGIHLTGFLKYPKALLSRVKAQGGK